MKIGLFIKNKHLGDSVILTSAIEALPNDWMVDLVCFPESRDIFKNHPKVRFVHVVPRGLKGLASLTAYFTFYKRFTSAPYDCVIQFSDDWRGAIIAALTRSTLRIAYAYPRRGWLWRMAFKTLAKRAPNRVASEMDLDLLRKFDLYDQNISPDYAVYLDQSSENVVETFITEHQLDPNRLICVQAVSRWRFKEIATKTWSDTIAILQANGYQVVLMGAKSDYQRNQVIVDQCIKPPIIAHNFSILESAGLLKKARLLISIDSLAIHLASAVRTPVVGMYGPSSERVWAPKVKSYQLIALSDIYPCRPCGLDGCAGTKKSQCLYSIDSLMVLNKISKIIEIKDISLHN
jgi:heptosyltransferase-3